MAMDLTVGKRGRKGPRPEMNVTPLVDVVLVLQLLLLQSIEQAFAGLHFLGYLCQEV